MSNTKIKQALQLAGNQHKYQWLLVLFISIVWIQINFILLGSTYMYMDPVFNCLSTQDQRIYQQQACSKIDECVLIDQFTITSQLSLYCQRQWMRDIIQSIFPVGSFVGLLIMNMISDTNGRKISTLISLALSSVATIFCFIGAYFKLVPFLIMAQFCGGFGAYSIVTLSYTLLSDFCSDSFRPRAVVLVNSAWAFSTLLLGLFYLVQLNWFPFLVYIMMIPVVFVSLGMYKFLLQSPYILVNQNKRQQAMQVLIKIATLNKKQQNIIKIKELISHEQNRQQINKPSIRNVIRVIKQWQYLKPIMILTVIYATGNINFYGQSYAIDMEGLGYGYNSIIAGFVETVTFIVLQFIVNLIPRKKGISGFYTIVMILGLSFVIPYINQHYIIGTIFIGLSRSCSTFSYTLIACMQTESFTVEIQSSAAGIIQAFSLVGALLAPILVDISDKIGMNPMVLISIFVNFAIWPPIFMKQTLVKKTSNEQSIKQSLLQEQRMDNPEDIIFSSKKNISSSSTIISEEGQFQPKQISQ